MESERAFSEELLTTMTLMNQGLLRDLCFESPSVLLMDSILVTMELAGVLEVDATKFADGDRSSIVSDVHVMLEGVGCEVASAALGAWIFQILFTDIPLESLQFHRVNSHLMSFQEVWFLVLDVTKPAISLKTLKLHFGFQFFRCRPRSFHFMKPLVILERWF